MKTNTLLLFAFDYSAKFEESLLKNQNEIWSKLMNTNVSDVLGQFSGWCIGGPGNLAPESVMVSFCQCCFPSTHQDDFFVVEDISSKLLPISYFDYVLQLFIRIDWQTPFYQQILGMAQHCECTFCNVFGQVQRLLWRVKSWDAWPLHLLHVREIDHHFLGKFSPQLFSPFIMEHYPNNFSSGQQINIERLRLKSAFITSCHAYNVPSKIHVFWNQWIGCGCCYWLKWNHNKS